jgi:hypothetical protein
LMRCHFFKGEVGEPTVKKPRESNVTV